MAELQMRARYAGRCSRLGDTGGRRGAALPFTLAVLVAAVALRCVSAAPLPAAEAEPAAAALSRGAQIGRGPPELEAHAARGPQRRALSDSYAAPTAAPRGQFTARYAPGRAELPWLGGGSLDGRTCDVAADPSLIALQAEALRSADALRAAPATPVATAADARSALSHMVYCPARGAGECRAEPIEPLNGFGRHPYAEVGCQLHRRRPPALPREKDIFDIDYLILASRCPAAADGGGGGGGGGEGAPAVHTGRNFFFDAGCSVYSRPRGSRASRSIMGEEAPPLPAQGAGSLGSAFGPSLPLFSRMYRDRCIEFDRIWGWEARPFSPAKWWERVPIEVRSKLHFFNVPIELGGAADPLLTIAQVARPEDFVVLKLDIDTFGVEHEVVQELRTNRRKTNASMLVDEFFFEYHFSTPREPHLHYYWPSRTRGGSVDDAVALMSDLRKLGIRAHFWI